MRTMNPAFDRRTSVRKPASRNRNGPSTPRDSSHAAWRVFGPDTKLREAPWGRRLWSPIRASGHANVTGEASDTTGGKSDHGRFVFPVFLKRDDGMQVLWRCRAD